MVIWLCLDCMRKQMQIGMDMEHVRKCCRRVDAHLAQKPKFQVALALNW